MIKSTFFFYKDEHDNVYNEEGKRVFDPMEGVLTDISDPSVVLETIASQKSFLILKPAEKENTAKDTTKRAVEVVKSIDNSVYKDYKD